MAKILLSTPQIILRLLIAFVVGWILGKERKLRHKPVGSRTHVLICVASTIITIISAYGYGEFETTRTMDPARLMTGILAGIGFIGAGIIWKDHSGDIQGITTAANIFLTACLGIAIGMGHYTLTALTTVLAIVTLELSTLEAKVKKTRARHQQEKMPAGTNPNWNYELHTGEDALDYAPEPPAEESEEENPEEGGEENPGNTPESSC